MGLLRGTNSPCRIPVRSERVTSPPTKQTNKPCHRQSNSLSARPSFERNLSGRNNNGRQFSCLNNYKQPSVRTLQLSEASYLPPRGHNNNRQQHPSFEKDFGPFGTVHNQRHFNSHKNQNSNEIEDINSMFGRQEYDIPINRSDRLAGSYRLSEAARKTTSVKGSDYGRGKTWDTGVTHESKDNGNPLLRPSQLPPPNEPIVNGGTNSVPSSSRRSVNRNEELDRILAKYGKGSKANLNAEKDPDFSSVVRTDTTLRVTTDRYCKPAMNAQAAASGLHSYWDGHPQVNQQQQDENDILSKLNCAIHEQNVHGQRDDRTVQLPGPDGPVLAPMRLMENNNNLYQVTPNHQHGSVDNTYSKSQSPVPLRRSMHVFPFKETPSGHLVIDPVQIAFESRKISVLVSDPNNNTATVEFTTTKCGTNNVLFQSCGNHPFVNKNERILHEVKKAMSIQETNEQNAVTRNSNSKLPLHLQPRELNQKRYSNSSKATEEFEQSILQRVATGRNADTHVMIGDKIFPCHSLALEAFSTYFERLSRPSEYIQKIQLPEAEVAVTAFPVLMDWVLQSEEGRKEIITKENLVAVYSAARHLGMKDLELQCVTVLERKVDSTDPDLMVMWDDVKRRQSSLPELVKIIAGKMASSYHEIYRAKRFLQMDIDELYMLLNSDDISIESEMEVYDSAVTWLLHDWKHRKMHTHKIMSTVRFGLLSPLQLTQINLCPEISKLKNEKDYNQIITYGSVKSMIDEGLSYSILDDSYKAQPEELKKWVEKTGVKAPAPRSCLVNRKRASPLILDKIASLEGASQTKLETSFHKLPPAERSSSYTLLGTQPKPGTPFIESVNQNSGGSENSSNAGSSEGMSTNCNNNNSLPKFQRGKSNLPIPRGGNKGGGSGIFTVTDKSLRNENLNAILSSNQDSCTAMQELMSSQKLQSNSSNTLQSVTSETNGVSSTDPYYLKREYEYENNNYNSSIK